MAAAPIMRGLVLLALMVAIVCVIVPFSPTMPADGLDPSWQFAMNQAVAQNLRFGTDIVFTLGPYASLYTTLYHPGTDKIMLIGSIYIAIAYCLLTWKLVGGAKLSGLVVLWVVWGSVVSFGGRDSIFLTYPFLVAVFLGGELNSKSINSRNAIYCFIVFFPVLGLLPIIKGSFLLISALTISIFAVFFISQKRYLLAMLTGISPCASMAAFWWLSGQGLVDLPIFLGSILPVISGYTEAMAHNGAWFEIVLFLLAAFSMVFFVRDNFRYKGRVNYPVVLSAIGFLFVVLKAGFVRHDGHAVIAGASILLATAYLGSLGMGSKKIWLWFFVAMAWFAIDAHYVKTSTDGLAKNMGNIYKKSFVGLSSRVNNSNELETKFGDALRRLQALSNFPLIPGSADIYSYQQSRIISSGVKYNPRPVIQSYSAYTPGLAELNRLHLVGKNPPDNILFTVQPIDGRLPSLEDGSSWPILLACYRPKVFIDGYLHLERSGSIGGVTDSQIKNNLTEWDAPKTARLGEVISVPDGADLVFGKVELNRSALGSTLNIIFKTSVPHIYLNLSDGSSRRFRLVSGMARAPFLISPLVENGQDFYSLYPVAGGGVEKKVISFAIDVERAKYLWRDEMVFSYQFLDRRNGSLECKYPG